MPKEYQKQLLWFCGHAREVFKIQPTLIQSTRRSLYGFFIRGSVVELCVIDRSGLHACKKLDVHRSPHRFIRVMAGYMMTEDEKGLYIMFKGEDEAKEEELYLEHRHISSQRVIVCRGTACNRAKKQKSKCWEFGDRIRILRKEIS